MERQKDATRNGGFEQGASFWPRLRKDIARFFRRHGIRAPLPPAVAGAPAPAAAVWLRCHEGLERGWYAAPIGWLDAADGGEFCVGLRSALIRNGLGPVGQPGASRARLFAGAGIVAGSDPERELVETRIKLRALLAPLTEI